MNQLYQMYNNQPPQNNIIQNFLEFKKNYTGNAKAQVEQMLNSGVINQQQYNLAVQKAQMLQSLLGRY